MRKTSPYAKREAHVMFELETDSESSYEQMRANILSVLTSAAMRVIGQNPNITFDARSLTLFLALHVATGEKLPGLKHYTLRLRGLEFIGNKLESVEGETIEHSASSLRKELRQCALDVFLKNRSTGVAGYLTFRKAAQNALTNFSREKYDRLQSRGKTTGRPKSYTYDDYLATLGMSGAGAARALGISRVTVNKMRDVYRDTVDADTGEVVGWYEPEEEFAGADTGRRASTDEGAWASPALGAEVEHATDNGGDVLY